MSAKANFVDIVLVLCILAAMIATVRMCAKDARRRGKSPWLITLLVVAFFPLGFVAWIVFRPKIIKPDQSRLNFSPDQ
jgi:uncharacterized membrane protein YhaH (DUF805 family)